MDIDVMHRQIAELRVQVSHLISVVAKFRPMLEEMKHARDAEKADRELAGEDRGGTDTPQESA